MSIVGITSARTRLVTGEREKDDFYRSPPRVTNALLAVEKIGLAVWDPACGDGAISNVLLSSGRSVISTDLIDRGFGTSGRDFLMEQELLAPSVVTNPPFKLADEFALHALSLGAQQVAIFQRTAWLEGTKRYGRLWREHPPIRVWVFSSRVPLWRGDDPNQKDTGGVMSLAWFVWERGFRGAPALGWLP